MMFTQETLLKNFQATREQIRLAALKSGRQAQDILLLAVSKRHSLQAIETLAAAGHLDFGENYMQEALEKIEAASSKLNWHFIGHLQTNKAKFAAGRFTLIHGLDSEKLALKLHLKCKDLNVVQKVLVQVNLAGEQQKGGISSEELPFLLEKMFEMDHVQVQGLMLMPPLATDPEQSRPFFARLRNLRDEMEKKFKITLSHLSMGMTSDFVQAIEEGATIIRVGTKIFGPRPCLK